MLDYSDLYDEPYDARRNIITRGSRRDASDCCPSAAYSFATAVIVTLLLFALCWGFAVVSDSARRAFGDGSAMLSPEKLLEDVQALGEPLSSLRGIIRGLFPYLVLAADLFVVMCRIFAVICEAL